MRYLGCLFLLFVGHGLLSQQVLQVEKIGSAKRQKIPAGTELRYQLLEDEIWYEGVIEGYMVPEDVIVFDDRLINVNSIEALQFERRWPKIVGIQLGTFGLAWSGFALIGKSTDGDPDTNYNGTDALISGTALASGFLVATLFSKKTIKNGKKYRLRLLDLDPLGPN